MVKEASPKKRKQQSRVAAVTTAHPLMLNEQAWDRAKTMAHIFDGMATSSRSIGRILEDGYNHRGQVLGLPSYSTIMQWLTDDPYLSERYARAHEARADYLREDLLELHDKVWVPAMVDGVPLVVEGKPIMTVDGASVQAVKIEADNKKWLMAKLSPKKYGDRVEQVHSGKVGLTQILSDLDGKDTGLPDAGED